MTGGLIVMSPKNHLSGRCWHFPNIAGIINILYDGLIDAFCGRLGAGYSSNLGGHVLKRLSF
jgi:hypothetical protein